MDNLTAFLAENVEKLENKKVIISKRFKDPKTKKPIEWELKQLTGEDNQNLQRQAMYQRNVNGRMVREMDEIKYVMLRIAESVVFPDLNNAALQDSYGVKTPIALLSKMLSAKELDYLASQVNDLSSEDDINDAVKDAKN